MLLIAFSTGTERNKRILIQRSQFLIIAAFAMIINKSKKQTFVKIVGLRFYISECNGQRHLANDEILFIRGF
jgi:hypothetical protein